MFQFYLSEGVVYRMNTTSGKTWALLKGSTKWEEISE